MSDPREIYAREVGECLLYHALIYELNIKGILTMNDQQIEQEIQARGLTAPRVTPQQIEAVIAETLFFTAADGVRANGAQVASNSPAQLLTICVLILRNGFTVLGQSACASPENFNAGLGRSIARSDAVSKVWALEGYALKERLALAAHDREVCAKYLNEHGATPAAPQFSEPRAVAPADSALQTACSEGWPDPSKEI